MSSCQFLCAILCFQLTWALLILGKLLESILANSLSVGCRDVNCSWGLHLSQGYIYTASLFNRTPACDRNVNCTHKINLLTWFIIKQYEFDKNVNWHQLSIACVNIYMYIYLSNESSIDPPYVKTNLIFGSECMHIFEYLWICTYKV